MPDRLDYPVPDADDDLALSDDRNPHFDDVVAARLSRRDALKGLFAAGAVGAAAATLPLGREALAAAETSVGFKSLPLEIDKTHHVAPGYRADVVVRWGDPLTKGARPLDVARQTPASQATQFGYNNDFIGYLPLPAGSNSSDHGLLWVNHEYTNGELMRPGVKSSAENAATADKAWTEVEIAAHGGSVVEVRKQNGAWTYVPGGAYNRRITGTTPIALSGPAAGHPRLRTKADPTGRAVSGTLNNCSGGVTPWGTVLTAEENFNGYFAGDANKAGKEARNHKRYGVPAMKKAWYGWARNHDRFDIEKAPTEPNRFGWVVEIDPYDPSFQPVKRTALGRLKHEAATSLVNKDGRVVVYSGDDGRGEYVFKFVTRGRFDAQDRKANIGLLDEGTLYVARFAADGTVAWIDLVHGKHGLTAANGFDGQADVLIEARRAADTVGATRMDRPEDVRTNPVNGKVYLVLTNNKYRGVKENQPIDAANPRKKNPFGHIIEITPPGGAGKDADHAATTATWSIFVLAGNPADPKSGARYNKDQASTGVWFAAPDNIRFDPKGRVYVLSDQGSAQRKNKVPDGVWVADSEGPGKALFKLLFAVSADAEMCGGAFTPDGKSLFVAVQHPGEARGSTFATPSTRWPDFKEGTPPRPSVVAITKKDGGAIGG